MVVAEFYSGVHFVPIDLLEVRCGGLFSQIELVLPGGGDETGGNTIGLLYEVEAEEWATLHAAETPNTSGGATEKKAEPDYVSDLGLFGSPAPPLGVGSESPAAFQLMNDLCRHLIDRIEAMAG